MVVAHRALVILVTGTLGYSGAALGQALSSTEPPDRVGRLAFLQGTVSFHDANRSDWSPALVNTPLSSGDAVWTEPNAHSEISIAGSRVRMDGATQLDVMALDDSRTRLQVDQGRIDVKTFAYDARQPYEIASPRGVATLQQQGDYYVEAGSTQDPTRLGVRQGAAQFQAPDGRVLAVRAGEVAEISGDGSAMALHTIQAPPPPMPTYWAERDRVVAYDQPPQYLSAGVTGYEDLNYYGSWSNDPEYGQVWYARSVPDGWSPYSTGRWGYQPVYGWTWIDEQPWGFAPYHYGRWAQRNNRWFWVPPDRAQRPVYAPALVAFVGGTELGAALGAQNRQPVGWFPLGPREAYVPPYTANRDYYRRMNLAARVQDRVLEDRWQRAERHEVPANTTWMNRRFATVVPADDFARSRPVERAAIRIAPDKLSAVPVAAVAVPPSPTASVRAVQAPAANTAPNQRPGAPTAATAPAQPAMLQAIKPEPPQQKAPGPQIATRTAPVSGPEQKPALPQLAPRNASAPPLPQIQGERRPATTQPSQQATAPANQPAPTAPPTTAPTRPGQPQANTQPNAPAPQAPRPGEPPKPQAQPVAPQPQPQRQATPAPQPPPQPAPAPQPQRQVTPAPQPAQPPQHQPAPQPQQHEPVPPPQQQQLQRAPMTPPPSQAHVAPAPPPQPQPAPQAHAPAPPPQPQHQAAPPPAPHPAPPPQQAQQAPHPQPAPQPQPQQHQGQQKPDEKK
jgi:hypothetical protein